MYFLTDCNAALVRHTKIHPLKALSSAPFGQMKMTIIMNVMMKERWVIFRFPKMHKLLIDIKLENAVVKMFTIINHLQN